MTTIFKETQSPLDIIECIREGLPKSEAQHVFEKLNIPVSRIGDYLSVSYRTFARKSPEDRLVKQDTEMVYKLIMLLKAGVNLFGSTDKFNEWLSTDSFAFGGIKPSALLDTEYGIELVIQEISRIEQGIY